MSMVQQDGIYMISLSTIIFIISMTYTLMLYPNFQQFKIHPYKSLLIHKNPKAFYLGVAHHGAINAIVVIWYLMSKPEPIIILSMGGYVFILVLLEFLRFTQMSILLKGFLKCVFCCKKKRSVISTNLEISPNDVLETERRSINVETVNSSFLDLKFLQLGKKVKTWWGGESLTYGKYTGDFPEPESIPSAMKKLYRLYPGKRKTDNFFWIYGKKPEPVLQPSKLKKLSSKSLFKKKSNKPKSPIQPQIDLRKESEFSAQSIQSLNSDLCMICFTNQCNVVYEPCGHTGLCSECSESIRIKNKKKKPVLQKKSLLEFDCCFCNQGVNRVVEFERIASKNIYIVVGSEGYQR